MASSSTASAGNSSTFPIRAYQPSASSWPYTPADFSRQDETDDTVFYQPSRLVTHIDDNAISSLSRYYAAVLPASGRILELCSSWVSHFPPGLARGAEKGTSDPDHGGKDAILVTGYGMNAKELEANPILARRVVRDLNASPSLDDVDSSAPNSFDAALCVVSIDYLTKPLEILGSVLKALKPGASVHLAISNRCFPTKAVSRWLSISEEQRLRMVGDYLWFSGFRNIEIVTVVDNAVRDETSVRSWFAAMKDPLWVVRGQKLDPTAEQLSS